VRLPLNLVNATGQRASHRTLTAPYYGWILVGALGATEVISWGVLYYAFSVFLTPMESDLGWSRAETTGAFSLALLLSGFAAIGAGRWLDRHGDRVLKILMTTGSCMGRCAGAGLGLRQHAPGFLRRLGSHRARHCDGSV
jgi:MFS family permease